MIIHRWQGVSSPTADQIKELLSKEGLDPFVRTLGPEANKDQPEFDMVSIVVLGEAIFELNSRQFLLKTGDRIRIPAGTYYTNKSKGDECSFVCAYTL